MSEEETLKITAEILLSGGSEYQGWLHSPLIVDRFIKPARTGSNLKISNRLDYYLQHCWPSISQIVSRVEEIRRTSQGKGLKRLHVMTNGVEGWVGELKTRLQESGHWERISTSNELELTNEQLYIGQAVDMAIAMRSQVFIGNGVGSGFYRFFIELTFGLVLKHDKQRHTPALKQRN